MIESVVQAPAKGWGQSSVNPVEVTWPARPGLYALVLWVKSPINITIGHLGTFDLPRGRLVYVGSACGPGGLRSRLARHLRAEKRRHWHVDYLLAHAVIERVIVRAAGPGLECAWAQELLTMPGASAPIPGFGSSDCRSGCPSHLIQVPEDWMAADDIGDTVQALLDAIAAGDDVQAETVAASFAGRSDRLPALRPLLADTDANRRWWGVRVLALIGGEEAVALAIRHLTDPDEATRCAAALALGYLKASEAVPELIARLADESGWVRDSAADALALIGEGAVLALVGALADHRDGVRVRAAGALRKIVVSRLAGLPADQFPASFGPAIQALFAALNDPNRLVRHNAFEALAQLGLFNDVLVAP